jgi:hypothetical protein
VNAANRRTVATRDSTVPTASSRAACCAAQPRSIASNTASSGCRCTTEDDNTDAAEPSGPRPERPTTSASYAVETDERIIH